MVEKKLNFSTDMPPSSLYISCYAAFHEIGSPALIVSRNTGSTPIFFFTHFTFFFFFLYILLHGHHNRSGLLSTPFYIYTYKSYVNTIAMHFPPPQIFHWIFFFVFF